MKFDTAITMLQKADYEEKIYTILNIIKLLCSFILKFSAMNHCNETLYMILILFKIHFNVAVPLIFT